jgi:PPOX class probable F420-dependent enzyme
MGINQRAAVTMTEAEIDGFVTRSRTATLATKGPDGVPHLVAMWFAWIDGKLWFETKAKSQKAVNIRRDPVVSCMIEAGDGYDQLRGVSIEGTAVIVDDTASDEYWAVAVNIWERYNGPYTQESKPLVEFMMNKRVVVRVDPARVRSWDHRKLGLPEMPPAGTTAEFLHRA